MKPDLAVVDERDTMGKPLRVGDLKKLIEAVADDLEVILEVGEPDGVGLVQASLRLVAVEETNEGGVALYLWGSFDSDVDQGLVRQGEVR